MLIPSIDLMGGRIVQLVQGETLKLAFDDFEYWIDRFSKYPIVQLIDLDAAMRQGDNRALIEMIAKRLPCQVGGGLKTADDGHALLDAGAKRVIYGSSLFGPEGVNKTFAAGLKKALGEDALVFSVDTKGGRVAVRGWKDTVSLTPEEAVTWLEDYLRGVPLHARRYRRHDVGIPDRCGCNSAGNDRAAVDRCRRHQGAGRGRCA